MKPTPINMAESVFEPFWDPALSGLRHWVVEPGAAHGLQVRQNWCWVHFEWARRPDAGPALRMSRELDLDCTGYDTLLCSVMAPPGAAFRMTARTDRGTVAMSAPPATTLKKEHALPLGGASRIRRITLELDAGADDIAAGWFNWLGLQCSSLVPHLLDGHSRFDAAWEGYLQPESYEPRFEPSHGFLVSREELPGLRARHADILRREGATPFTRRAEALRAIAPEPRIRDFVNFWGDTRYCRERDHGNELLNPKGTGAAAAAAALLLRDRGLLRLAARYAMSIGMCDNWDDGMICRFPGGTFEHRCFVQSLCVHEIALVLDMAGEMFTDLGRRFLLRRIAEEGLGTIHFNVWQHEYIFHCNQLAWFSPGRMLGCALLERSMPRARDYTELAYRDLVESVQDTVLPDGGYVEGPSYFRCVGRDAGLALYYYARARGLPFEQVIPDAMRRSAAFGDAIASTDDSADAIPICDAGATLDHEMLSVLGAVLPRSAWAGMYRKAIARSGAPDSLFAWNLDSLVPAEAPPPPPLTAMPDMGLIASARRLGPHLVKILLMGNKAGAGHTHEDKGSFVLEFAGETFAMDPGTCNYSSPFAGILKNAERHNMLIPCGTPVRPQPACPLPVDVKPEGTGDATRFSARIDATPGWEPYYRRWVRTWDSPTPGQLTITDEYELADGDAVEFCWQTRREVSVRGREVTLAGAHGTVILTAPDDTTIRVDELPLGDGTQRRVAIRREGRSGSLTVRVRLVARSE